MEGSVIYPKLESLGVYRISAQLFRWEGLAANLMAVPWNDPPVQ